MSRPRVVLRRQLLAAVALALTATAVVAIPASAATLVLKAESFSGATTVPNEWLYGGSGGVEPCLTAAPGSTPGSLPACFTGDAVGSGAVQFTSGNSQAGYIVYNTPVQTGVGLQIAFDMFQYGGGSDAGDGMSFMLIDGAATPTAIGAQGASLGYSTGGSVHGIVGGYVGVGFDVYGANANPGVGTGGPGGVPNQIVLRGSEESGYAFIAQKPASGSLNEPSYNRELARRHVVVTVSSESFMSVAVDYGSGLVTELDSIDLATINGAGSLPSTLKVGFTASTGGAWDVSEIQNFQMTTLTPDLGITVVPGTINSSTLRGSVGLAVAATSAGGSTTGPVTVAGTVPAGATALSASGTGWSCAVSTPTVTCTRPGTGADRLDAAESYPLITLAVSVASPSTLPLSISASVSALDDSESANDSASGALTLGAALADTNGVASPWVAVLALGLLGAGILILRHTRIRYRP